MNGAAQFEIHISFAVSVSRFILEYYIGFWTRASRYIDIDNNIQTPLSKHS
jgi:hypothetical protein